MKEAFFDALCELAANNSNIEFIKADIGFNAKYQNGYPNQYLNIGICEQNMIGVAAGMAMEGKIVFVYSLVDFASLRALDQIRVAAGYYNLNIKIVSCGTGFDYCDDGVSHIAVDDVTALRVVPNLTLFSPADPYEAEAATKVAAEISGPCFIRLGRGGEPKLHASPIGAYKPGQVLNLREGSDVKMLVTGSITGKVLAVADKLAATGVDVGVYSFPTIRPIDREFIQNAANATDMLITIEENLLPGGFGGAVAEIIAEMQGRKARFKRIGIAEDFQNNAMLHSEAQLKALFTTQGPAEYMRTQLGITADGIEASILKFFDKGENQ